MKKKMLFILPLATLCVVGVGASSYQVLAEGEETSIVEPVEEETPVEESESKIDWEEVQKALDEAQAKLKKAMEYQILGVTVGTILGTIISILLSVVFKKVGNKNIENAVAVVKNSHDKVVEVNDTAKVQLTHLEELALQLKEQKDLNESQSKIVNDLIGNIKGLKEENKLLAEDILKLKDILLKMAYSNKDLVKNGVASELHENYDK